MPRLSQFKPATNAAWLKSMLPNVPPSALQSRMSKRASGVGLKPFDQDHGQIGVIQNQRLLDTELIVLGARRGPTDLHRQRGRGARGRTMPSNRMCLARIVPRPPTRSRHYFGAIGACGRARGSVTLSSLTNRRPRSVPAATATATASARPSVHAPVVAARIHDRLLVRAPGAVYAWPFSIQCPRVRVCFGVVPASVPTDHMRVGARREVASEIVTKFDSSIACCGRH